MDEKEKGSSQFIDDWKEIVDTCDLPENFGREIRIHTNPTEGTNGWIQNKH